MSIIDKIDSLLNEKLLYTITDADVKKVSGLTGRNDHQEAYLYIAKDIMKDKKLTKEFQDIVATRDKKGEMDSELTKHSRDMYKKMFDKLKSRTSPEDYKKIYMST